MFTRFAAGCLAAMAGTAQAQTVIDFESFNLSGQTFLITGSPLVFLTPGVTVTMHEGAHFRVYDLFRYAGEPLAVGQALIDMPWTTFINPNGTEILFDAPVSDFSLRAGDFGGDDDSPLRIEAFNEHGASLGVNEVPWPAGRNPPFATLRLNVSGIRRVKYSSGGAFPGSTFFDDITFTAPPSSCYPDCDTSTGPGVLDIFDFLCFGNRFASGDPYACDCDVSTGPNVCDIFDFLCFGNEFSNGCP